jgi:hypothetical protein
VVGDRQEIRVGSGAFLVACVTPLSAQQDQQLTSPKLEGKVIFGSALFGEDLEHKLVGVPLPLGTTFYNLITVCGDLEVQRP